MGTLEERCGGETLECVEVKSDTPLAVELNI